MQYCLKVIFSVQFSLDFMPPPPPSNFLYHIIEQGGKEIRYRQFLDLSVLHVLCNFYLSYWNNKYPQPWVCN